MAPHTANPAFSSAAPLFFGLVFLFGCNVASAQDTTLSPICGSSIYDIATLTAAPYWTVKAEGLLCNETIAKCVFNLAFCKALPEDKTGGVPNIGASQTNDLVGSTPLVLGHTNSFTDDRSGNQLIVTYADGAAVKCGNINVFLFLKCNPNVFWEVPLDKSEGVIPNSPIINPPTENNCYYNITAEYAGACETLPDNGLSGGTVVIIIFFVAVTVYFLSGLVYNMMSGAQGYELIPNYEMWKRLPSDIMIGCGFFFSCITCQGPMRQSADSYDAI